MAVARRILKGVIAIFYGLSQRSACIEIWPVERSMVTCNVSWKTIAMAVLFGLTLSAGARAADYDDQVFGQSAGRADRLAQGYGHDDDRPRWGGNRGESWRDRDEGRSFARPGPEWRGRWGHPVAGGPWWRHRAEACRVIVKRRANPWGEVTVRRIEVCD